ncbi:hypothetical protein Tco_1276662 [Tanacetum coccineum]
MFQQHQGESLSEAWTRFKDLLQKVPHHSIDLWLQVQIFYAHVNPVTRRTIDPVAGGKLRDKKAKESWALLEDLALYDNESWNDPRDFAKLNRIGTPPPRRVHFVNTITIIRKEDGPKEEEILEPNAIKNSDFNTVVEIEKKVGGEFSGSETVVKETKSRDIKRDNPDDRACGATKEVDEVEEESEESEEEVEEE